MLTPAERRDLAALRDRLAALERRVGSVAGAGVSNRSGPVQVRTTQLGFPAELTAAWDATAGYAWKRLRLTGVTTDDPTIQPTGTGAVTPDGDETLEAGVRGWMEPSPDAQGYYFVTGSGESAATSTDDPVPTATPLECPVDPPSGGTECCYPDDTECCPTIYMYPFPTVLTTSGNVGPMGAYEERFFYWSWYYYDCHERIHFFTPESDPELFDRCVNELVITCPRDPSTGELKYYFQGECKTCAAIHLIDPDYVCAPPVVRGPVCVFLSDGSGVFAGLNGVVGPLPVGPSMDIPFDYSDPVRHIQITGVLTYVTTSSLPGWYFFGSATSAQDGGGGFACGCRVVVTRGFFTGEDVVQTITSGPVLGAPPTESLYFGAKCGTFLIRLGACPSPPPPPPPPPPASCCEEPAFEEVPAEPLASGPDLLLTGVGTITLTRSGSGDISTWVGGAPLWTLNCETFGEWRLEGPAVVGGFATPTSVFCIRPTELNPAGVFVLTFAAADFVGATEDPTVTLIP